MSFAPGRFLRAVAHARPRQLAWRLVRIGKRVAHDRFAWCERLDGPTPGLAPAPPRAIFAPRLDRSPDPREPNARVVARTYSLRAPIDWRPRGWSELEATTLHYHEFLEALDDAAFAHVVSDWIATNPLRARGARKHGWSTYALSLRMVVWMQQLAARRARLDGELLAAIHASLAQQARFLERNLELDLGGNHLIKNAKALAWCGRYFAGAEADRWLARGREIVLAELDEQVLADGMHFERSPAYHAQVFADLLECATLFADARLDAALTRMAQALADTTHPDGFASLFNDGGLHTSYAPRELLAAYGATVTPRRVFALPHAGYFGARIGDSFVLADCGPIAPDHLPAHGHGDALAFEWSVAGRRVIVDAGVFEYAPGSARSQSRSTRMHNTVTLDDADQCEFWSSFRVGRRLRATLARFEPRADGFVVEGSHDGFAHLSGAPIHARKLTATRDSLSLDDEIRAGAGQRVHARLLLHPDATVEVRGDSLCIRVGPLAVELAATHAVEVVDASWSPDLGVRRATKQIVIAYGPAPCAGSFSLRRIAGEDASGARGSAPASLAAPYDRAPRAPASSAQGA